MLALRVSRRPRRCNLTLCFIVEQGFEMRRPSILEVSSVLVGRGEIEIPD